jgi:hypothetical protein
VIPVYQCSRSRRPGSIDAQPAPSTEATGLGDTKVSLDGFQNVPHRAHEVGDFDDPARVVREEQITKVHSSWDKCGSYDARRRRPSRVVGLISCFVLVADAFASSLRPRLLERRDQVGRRGSGLNLEALDLLTRDLCPIAFRSCFR